MVRFYLTDDYDIYKRASSICEHVYLIKTTYSIKVNGAGTQLIRVQTGKHDVLLSITEFNSSDRLSLEQALRLHDDVTLVNIYKATQQSQFAFDILLTQLKDSENITDVRRLWLNDINDLKKENLLSNTLESNKEYLRYRLYHLVIEAVNSFWMHSPITSNENCKLNLFHYYILSLIYESSEAVRADKQQAFFQIDSQLPGIKGKLQYKGRHMFSSFDEAEGIKIKIDGPLMVYSSKYSEKECVKPLLFTFPSLAKEFSKLTTLKEVVTNLYTKGYITNPFTNNTTLPSSVISTLQSRLDDLSSRYEYPLSLIEKAGLTGVLLDTHLKEQYQNDYLFMSDKTHAILPIPNKDLAILSDTELEVYDAIVFRFLTMFFSNPIKFSKRITLSNTSDISIKYVKEGYLSFGHEILSNDASNEETEQSAVENADYISKLLPIGTIIYPNDLNLKVSGNLSRAAKHASKRQIITSLINMGKSSLNRKKILKDRNNILGDSAQWNNHVEYLENLSLIDVDDKKLYFLTSKGHSFLQNAKSYLVNCENLTKLYRPIQSVLDGCSNPLTLIENQVKSVLELEFSPTLSKRRPANYQFIVNNHKCPCGEALKLHENFIGCSAYPKCKFSIPKSLNGHLELILSENNIIELLTKRETSEVFKDFVFRSGKKGTFKLALDSENKLAYHFLNVKT